MKNHSRREFVKISGLGLAGATLTSFKKSAKPSETETLPANIPFQLAIASYTFRKFKLDETLTMTRRLGIEYIALKDFHLPQGSTEEEIKAVVEKVKEAGIILYGGGVIYMRNEEEVNRAFEYARLAGMKVIIGVPEHHLLQIVGKKVKESGIKLAIHNHGPGDKRYPSPESAYEKIKDMDPGMGLCIDIGHAQRLGIDPAIPAEKYFDRIHDVHIKDVSSSTKEGGTIEIGRGVIDIPGFLKVLIKKGYKGKIAFEFEKDVNDPLPGLAESVGYVRGVLDILTVD
jgi:inosose dehydratase